MHWSRSMYKWSAVHDPIQHLTSVWITFLLTEQYNLLFMSFLAVIPLKAEMIGSHFSNTISPLFWLLNSVLCGFGCWSDHSDLKISPRISGKCNEHLVFSKNVWSKLISKIKSIIKLKNNLQTSPCSFINLVKISQ